MNIYKLIKIILIGIIFHACSLSKEVRIINRQRIEIIDLDSLKFENYNSYKFKTANGSSGYILQKKRISKSRLLNLSNSRTIYFDELCNINEFQDSEINYRGHSINSRIYRDEKLYIDLSKTSDKKYYNFCSDDLSKSRKVLNGNIKTDGEILIGASISLKGSPKSDLSDINGNFKIYLESDKDFDLVINPCCTSFTAYEITIERNVYDIQINCDCQKSRMVIKKKFIENDKILIKSTKKKL